MACGCKNKGNQTQTTQTTQQTQTQQTTTTSQTESVKDAIKKTIEKYYNTTVTSNGWIKG